MIAVLKMPGIDAVPDASALSALGRHPDLRTPRLGMEFGSRCFLEDK